MKLPVVWILSIICLTIFAKSTAEEPRIVCYYTNWSIYRPGNAKYSPQNINPYLCTHLIYAFGGFTKDNTLQPFDKYQDIEKGGYAKFTGLKTYNKNLKTMLAIGGWNEASSRFSPLVGDAERRRIFVKNTIKYLRQNHFDGLDLDWEYPTFRDGGKMKDRVNYAQFVQELREEFDRESSKTGRPRLLLTLAIPAGVDKIEQGYDVVKLNQYLDWFNVLTYDYHDSFEPATNHHAPLYSLEEDDEYNYDGELNIDFSVKYLINAGADRQKLVLGIPTYGRSYTLFNPDATDIGAPTDGPGDPGDATREKGFLAYYEICQNIKSDDEWTVMHPNDNVMGPYLYKDDQWISYDDEKMARKKAQYAAKNGLGGIMFWSIDTDDFRGTCSGKPYPLIEAAKEGFYDALGIKSTDSKEVVVKTTPRNRKRPTRPTKKPVVSNEASNSLKDTFTRRQKPSQTTRVPAQTESSIVYNKRTTTPEPPTTPDPGSDFKCEDEGFFSHPRDCKKYFWCLDSGPANLGIVAHQFTCPSGLVFNKQADSCDYARNVICEKTKPSTTTTSTPPTTTSKTTTKLSTTQRTTTFRTTTSRPTITSTTTPAYDDDEEYEDEIEDSEFERDIEDPKVIKELIDLIKKAGGLDKLEKHLKISEDNSPLFDNTKSDKLSTTQATFSKSLYDKVLLRKPENRFSKNENTNKIKSDQEVISVTPKANNTRYSSVYRNSRPSPQNAGLDNLPEFEGFLKEKPQYVTIERHRTTIKINQNSGEDDTSLEDDKEEYSSADTTPKSVYRTTAQPQYVNIQRNRVTTESTNVDESDFDEFVLNPYSRPIESVTQSSIYSTINRGGNTNHEASSEISSSSESPIQYSTINRGQKPENNDSAETVSISDTKSTQYTTINRETKLGSANTVEIALNSERGSTQYATVNRGRRPDDSNSEETTITPDIEATTQYATISSDSQSINSETSEKTSTSDADTIQHRPRFNPNRRRRPENSGVTEIPALSEIETTTQRRPNNRRRRPNKPDTTEISSPSNTESTTEYATINRRRRPDKIETSKISLVSEKESTAKTAEVSSSVNTRTQTRYQTFSRGATTARPSEDPQAEVKISSQTSSTDEQSGGREEDVDAPDKRVFPVIINSNTKYQTITRNQIKTTLLETTLPTIADDIFIPQNNTTDLLAENAIQKETSPPPTPAIPVINQYTNNELTTKQNQLDHNLTNPTNTINISANQINTDITYTLQSHQSPNIIQNDPNDVQAKTVENVTEFITTKLSSPRPFGFQKPNKTILLNQTHDAPKVSQVENLEQNKTISYPNNYQQTNLGKNATKQESEIKPLVDRTRFRFTSYTSPNTIIDFKESTTISQIIESNLDGDALGTQEIKISSSTGSNVSKQTAFKSRDSSATNLKLNDAAQDAKTQSYSDNREFKILSSTSQNSNEDGKQSTNSNQVSFKSRNVTRNLNTNEITQEANIEPSADRRGFRISSTGNPNELEKTELSHQTVLESENFKTNDIIQEQKTQSSFYTQGFRISASTRPNSSDDFEQSTTTNQTNLNTNNVAQGGKIHTYSDTREFRISSATSTNSNEYVEQSTISNETSFKSQNSTINLTRNDATHSSEDRQGVRISSTDSPNELEQTAISHKSVLESENFTTNLKTKVTAQEQNIQSSSDRQGFGISSSTSPTPSEDLEQSTIISESSFKSRNSAVNLNTNDASQDAKAQASLDRRGFRISSSSSPTTSINILDQTTITDQTSSKSRNSFSQGQRLQSSFDARGFRISSSTSPNSSEDLEQSTITNQISFKSRNSTTNLNERGNAQDGKIQSHSDTLGFRISSVTSPNSSQDVEQSTISNQTLFESQNSEDSQGIRILSTDSPNELEQTEISHNNVLESENSTSNLETKVTAQEQNVQSSSGRQGFGISASTSPNPSEELEQSAIISQSSFKSRNSAVNLNTNDASQDAKSQASLDRREFRISSSSTPTSSNTLEKTTITDQTSSKSRNSFSQGQRLQPSFDARGFRISSSTSPNSSEDLEQSTIISQISFKSRNSTTNLDVRGNAQDGKIQSYSDTLGFRISSVTSPNSSEDVKQSTISNQTTQGEKIHSSEDSQGVRILSADSPNELEQTAISHKSVLESESSKTNLEAKLTAQDENVQFSSDRLGFGIAASTSPNPSEDLEQSTIISQSSFKSRHSAVTLNTNDATQDAKTQASLDRRGFRISSSSTPTSSNNLDQTTITDQTSPKSRNSSSQGQTLQFSSDAHGFRISSATSPNSSQDVEQSTISNQTSFKSQNSEDRQGIRISSTGSSNGLEQTAISHKSVVESESSKTNLEAKETAQEQNIQSSSDRLGFGIAASTSSNPSEDLEQSTITSQSSFKSRNSAVNLNINDASQDAKAQASLDRRGYRISSSTSPNLSENLERSTVTSQTSFKSRNSTSNWNASGTAQDGKIQSNSDTLGFRISSVASPNSSEDVKQSTISNETSIKSQNSTINLTTNDATHSSEDRQDFGISSTGSPNELEQTAISHKSVLESESSKTNLEAKVTAQEQNIQSSSDRLGFGIAASTSSNPSEELEQSAIISQSSFKSRNSAVNLNTNDASQDAKSQASLDRRGFRISSSSTPTSSNTLEKTTITDQTSSKSRNSFSQGQRLQPSFDARGFRISSSTSPNSSEDLEQSTITNQTSFKSRNSTTNLNERGNAKGGKIQSNSDTLGFRISSLTSPNSSQDVEQSTISNQTSFKSQNSEDSQGIRISSTGSSNGLEQTAISHKSVVESEISKTNLEAKVTAQEENIQSSSDRLGFGIAASTSPNPSEDLVQSTITSQSSFKSRNSAVNLNTNDASQDAKTQNSLDRRGYRISSFTSPNLSENLERSTITSQTSFKSRNSTTNLNARGTAQDGTASSEDVEQSTISNQTTQGEKNHSSEDRQGVRISSTGSPNEPEQTEISHKSILESENSTKNLETKVTAQEQNIQSSSDRQGFGVSSSTSPNPSEDLEQSTITSQSSFKSRNSAVNLNTNDASQDAKTQASLDRRGFRISPSSSPTLSNTLDQTTITDQTSSKSRNSSSQGQRLQSSFDARGFRISSSASPNSSGDLEQSTITSQDSFKSPNLIITLKTNRTAEDEKIRDSLDRRGFKISSIASPNELDQTTISNETERKTETLSINLVSNEDTYKETKFQSSSENFEQDSISNHTLVKSHNLTTNLGSSSLDGQGLDILSSASPNEVDQVRTSNETLKKTQISITNLDSNAVNQELTTPNLGENLELTTIYIQTPFESRETTTDFVTTDTVEDVRNQSTVDRRGFRISQIESQNSTASLNTNDTTHDAKTQSSFDRRGFRISSSTSPKSIIGFEKSSISSQSLIESKNSKENVDSISTTTQPTQTKPTIHRGRFRGSTSSSPKSTIDAEQTTNSRQIEFEPRNTQQTDGVINSNALLNRNVRPTNFDDLSSLTSIDFNRRTYSNGSPVVRRRLRPTQVKSTTTQETTPESTERSRIRQRVRILPSTTPNSLNDFDGTKGSNTQSSFDRRGNRISSSGRSKPSTDSERTIQESFNGSLGFNSSSSTSTNLNLFETISGQTSFGSQNSTTSSIVTNIAQEAKSQSSIDTPQLTFSGHSSIESQKSEVNLGSNDTNEESEHATSSISNVDLHQTTISNLDYSSPDSVQQPTISSQTVLKSQNSIINLNTNDAAQDAKIQNSEDRKGLRISSTGSPSSSIDLDISNQTSFESRNSSRRGQTVQHSFEARGFRISSSTQSSSEDLDPSSITSQLSFKSRNSTTNLNERGNAQDGKIQSNSDTLGFRISSATSSNSSDDVEQSTISNQTSFKSQNSTINLITNDATQDEKIYSSEDSQGVRISSTDSPNEPEQTEISHKSALESENSTTNLETKVTAQEQNIQSSFDRQRFGISSSTSPNPSDDLEQSTITSQFSFKSRNSAVNLNTNDASHDAKAQTSEDRKSFRISSAGSPSSRIDLDISNQTSFESRNASRRGQIIQPLFDARGFRISSSTQPSSEDLDQSSITSQSSFKSRNSGINLNTNGSAEEAKIQASLDTRGFRIVSSTNPSSISDLGQATISDQTSSKSRNYSSQGKIFQSSIDKQGSRISPSTRPISSEDLEQSVISSQTSIKSRNSTTNLNSNDFAQDGKIEDSLGEKGFRISYAASQNELDQTTTSNETQHETPTASTNLGSNEATTKETQFQSSSVNFQQDSISNQNLVKSLNLTTNLGSISGDGQGLTVSSSVSPIQIDQQTLHKTQINKVSTTPNSGGDSELPTIYGQNLFESRNTTTTTDFGKTVNVQAVRNQSTVDRQGFRFSSSTSPKLITGFEKSTNSSHSLVESHYLKEDLGSISTTTQATETKHTTHRGRFRGSTSSIPKSTIDEEQTTSSRQIDFEPRNTQQTDGVINSNALLNRNVRPTNFDELSSLTSIDFNRRTYSNGSPVVRRRLRPTKVTSITTQEINPDSTERSRIRQRVRILQPTSPNSSKDFERANDSNTQSSFDRRGYRISTSARKNSSTDFEETNLNSEHTNQESSFDSLGLNISSSTNPILNLDVDQTPIFSQISIESQNSPTSLNVTDTVQELNLDSNNFTEEPEYFTISNDDLEQPTISSLDSSSPDSAEGFEQPTISSQTLFDSRKSTSNSITSQEAKFNSNVDRQGFRISSSTSPKSVIEQTTSSNQIMSQSRNSTENQRNKASVDRRRFKVSSSTNRPATAVNFQQTTSSSQILPETKGWVINRNRGTRKFFSRFTTEAIETFTETPYRRNLTRKSRPVYQETEEAVNYNSLLDRSIRPATLDELSSLTAFDFNRKNGNNGNTVIRRRPRPKAVTTTTTTAEEITSAATKSSSTTESSRIYKRPIIPRHRFLPPTTTTTATPAILADPIEIIESNSQIDTPSTEPSISLSLSNSYEFGFASGKQNSTVQTVFENDSSRISNINITTQSQDSTFSDQTDLTMPETEQIFQIDNRTAQIFSIAQNSLNVTTENNLSTTNNIVTNSSQHVPLSDSKSSETIKTRSRVRTVKRLRDPVKYIENTIETTGNTESRPAINFSLAANPTIETVANEGFNFQTTNTTTINSILINQTESDSQIRSTISTRAPNTEEPSTQTERRRQFQSRISTTPIPTLVTESNSDLTENQEGSGSSNTTKESRYKVVNQTFKRRPGTKLEINSNDTLEENVEANIERTKSVPKFNARTRRPRPFRKQETNSEETDDVGIVEENLPLVDEELESNTRKNSFIPPRRAFASRTTATPAAVNIQIESQISENITSTSEPKSTSRNRFKVFNRASTKKSIAQADVDIEDTANSEEDLANVEIETSSKIETPTQPRRKFAPRFSGTQSKTETESRFSGNINSAKNNVRTFTRKPIINESPTDNDYNSGENEELDSSIPVEATTQGRRKFFARPLAAANTQLTNETKTEVSENIDVSRQQNSSLPGRRKFISRVPTTPISLNTQSVTENINSTKVPRYNLLTRTRKPFANPVIKTEDDKSEENLPLADEEVDSVTLNTDINLVTDAYSDSDPQGSTTLEDENTEETFTTSTEGLKPHTSTTIKPRRVIKVIKGTKRPVVELKLDSTEELDQSNTEENLTTTEGELDQTTQNEPNDETIRSFPVLEINTQDEENVSSEDSELEFNAQKTSATYVPTTVTTTTTSTEDVLDNKTSTNAPRFKVLNRTFTRRPITQPETDDKPKENIPLGNAEVESNSQNGTTIQSSRKYVSRVSTAQRNAETSERPGYKVRAFTRKPTTRLTTTSNEPENSEENISSGNEEVESSSEPRSSVPTRRTLRPRFSTTPSTVSKKVNGEIQVSENVTATNASRFKPRDRTFSRRPSTKLEINSDGFDDENNSEEKTFVSDASQNITSTEYRKYTSRTSTTRSNSETESKVGYKTQTFSRKPVTGEADDEGRDSEENLALDNEEVESNTSPDASISTTVTNVNTHESDEAEIRDSENVTTTFVQGTMHDDNFELNITRTPTNQVHIETDISVSGNKNLTDPSNNGEEEVVESDAETNFSIPTRKTYVNRISTTPTTVNIQTKEESEKINSTSALRFKAFNRTFTQRPAIKLEINPDGSNVDNKNSDENSPIGDEDDESNSQIDSSTQSRRLNISRTSSAQTNSETEKRVAGNVGYKIRAFTRKPISNEPDNDDIGSEEKLDDEHIESNVQVDSSTSTRRTFTPRASIKSLKAQSNDEPEAPVSENINSNKYSLINRTRKPFGQLEINFNGSDDGENSEKILDDEDVEPNIQIDAPTERRKYISRITTTPVPPPIKYKVNNRPVSKSPFTTPKTNSNGSNDDENVEENLHNDEEDEASDEENTGNVNSPFPRYQTIDRTSTLRPFSNVNESDDNENSEGSQTNSETESRVSGNINSFNAPRYGVINRTRKPFTRPEINSNTPNDDFDSEENSQVDDDEDEVRVQSGSSGNINSEYKTFDRTNGRKPFTRLQINANEPDNNENEEDTQEFESNSQINSTSQTESKLQTNSETENRVSGNINSFNAPRYGVINRTRKPFTRPETNSNTPDGDDNSEENSHVDDEEDEDDEASLPSGNSGDINSRYKTFDRTSTRKPFTRLVINANEHEDNGNTDDSQEFESNSQIDSASQTGNKFVSRLSVTQKNLETGVLGNNNADNAPRYGVVNRTRKPFTRSEINSRTPEGKENSENNPSIPLRKKFVPRVSNIPTTLNVQSENRVVGNIPKFRTASPRPSPNLAVQTNDEDFDENETSEDGYDSFEENLTGNDEEVNSYSKIDTSTKSIRKFKPNSSNSINLNTPASTEPSLPAGYRNKAIFQRKPYARPIYSNEPSESDNSEEAVTLKTEDEESNTESDLNNDDNLVETTTIQGELISETISKINNNFTQTNNNSEGALWSSLSEQTNSTIYKILGSNIVDYRNESESLVQVNRSNNSPGSEKVINKPFSIRTQNSSNKVQNIQTTGSQNSPVQSIKIDSGKFIPFHLRPKTTFNKPSVQPTTPTIRFSHDEIETTTGSIPNTDYTNIPHSTTLDTITTLADTNLYSTLISQESTTSFAGEDVEKVTTEISINAIKILKPTTTTSKPTTLHHIFAVDYDSAEEDRNNGTNLGNSTELTDDDKSGNSKEASAEEISLRLEKLVEVNRIVEIYSKQQSNGRNDLSANSNELIVEKIPTLDKIGEISRWISVKLQNHNTGNSSNKFDEILQNITTLNSTANTTKFDSNMVFNVETSTIPLEGLFDKNKKNFTDNEVIDYQVTKPPLPSTPLASLVLHQLLPPPPPPPEPLTIIDSNPQNSKSFAGSTSFGIAAATIPSHSYVQQLRPESHEANPLVISIANLDQVVLSKSEKIDKKISFPSIIGSTESSNQLTFSSNSDNQTN